MQNFINTNIFFLIASLFCVNLQAQNKVDLSYDLVKGDTIFIVQEAKQTITQELYGVENVVTNNVKGEFNFIVKETTAESILLEARFKSLQFITASENYGVLNVMDTEAHEDSLNIASKALKGLLDVPFEVTLLKNGYVKEIRGTDLLISNMVNSMDFENDLIKENVKTLVSKEFGNERMSESLTQMFYILPNREVGINDIWKNSYQGKLAAQNEWKLLSIENDEAIITCDATIQMNVQDSNAEMNLTGIQTTDVTVDIESGLFSTMVVTQSSKGNSKVYQIGDEDIPMRMEATLTFKRI